MDPRVLVVEDDRSTQSLLQAVLRHNAIDCECVDEGAAALLRIARERYGAIVLDLLLPVRNGFEVLREMKMKYFELLAQVIVITAAADSTWSGCDELRFVKCLLRKPIDIEELVGQVRSCMAESAAGRQG